MTDNTIDIFSKRSLDDIEKEEEETRKEISDTFKEVATTILKQFQTSVDEGVITGLCITGTTEGGVAPPRVLYSSTQDLHKMSFVIDEMKLDVHEDIADRYKLREIQYIEE